MNIIPLYNTVIEKHIRVNGKFFKYKIIGRGKMNEGFIVNESLKEAFCLISTTYTALKKQDKNSLKIAGEILGSYNHKTLLNSIEKIGLKILNNTLVILRENYLDTENDNVLASVDKDDKKTFTVYDKFFDKLNCNENRAGIFIHEIAHLCNLDEEDEMKEIDSAECIKNICLCINGKIPLEQIKAEHKKEQQNPQKDREDGTLTYRPNPNRRNNGEFDFGPDRGSSSASGSGSSGENSGDEKSTSKKSSSGYKDDNFTLSSVGTNRTSDNNKVELEDCVKFGKHSKGGDSVWLGNGLSYKNDTFKEGDKVNIIYDLEFEESYTFNEDGSYIYNPPKKVSIAFEQIANSNGEVSLNRGGVLEIYSNRDKVFAVNVKISISIGKSKDIKNMKTKESNYNKEPDPDLNNVQDITYYPSSHKEKNKNEGRITNKDEITEGLKKFINVYKNKISIDLLSKELKSID